MDTKESPVVAELWTELHKLLGNRVMNGGSVPARNPDGTLNEITHSYHRSWSESPHDDGYSVHFPGDKSASVRSARKRDFSCAFDLSFKDAADIQKATARLHHWATTTRNNWGSPGLTILSHSPILREFAGTLDSQNVFAMDTSSFRKPFRTFGWDQSHLYHIHMSFNRTRILDRRIIPTIVDAFGDW